jgi:uncharacterized protein
MNEAHIQKIAGELKIQARQVLATARLFAEGATVPFIARYRKEATGSLDEVAVTNIRERLSAWPISTTGGRPSSNRSTNASC